MKHFIRKFSLFILPIIILPLCFFVYAEFKLFYYPSTFQLKAKHFHKNIDNIDVLILGSSHNQVAINPEKITNFNVSNLAFGGQNISIDSTLLTSYIQQIPKLKLVVFELSYHTLEHEYDPYYHRNSLYLRFYKINLFGRKNKWKDYSIYLSKPSIYNLFLNPFFKNIPINKYGFATELSSNDKKLHRFKNLNYNEELIMHDSTNIFISRHKYENINAYNSNTSKLTSLIELCTDNNITPIILMPPVYKNYYNAYLKKKEKRRRNFINELKKKYANIHVIDYESHPDFIITDFKNEDHLNPNGAKKFSTLLNKKLSEIKSPTVKIN